MTSGTSRHPATRAAARTPEIMVPAMPWPVMVLAPQRWSPSIPVPAVGRRQSDCAGVRAMP